MKKEILYVANWKMHKTNAEACAFVSTLATRDKGPQDGSVWIAPSFVSLKEVVDLVRKSKAPWIKVGGQNLHEASHGAFTGEVSALMLKDVGAEFVIIGHSERRALFGETDERIRKKVIGALDNNLVAILCVGEKQEDRDRGVSKEVVQEQIKRALAGTHREKASQLLVAYEPVWAIGTGQSATASQAEEMHRHIQSSLISEFGSDLGSKISILYGGSVNQHNAGQFIEKPTISGLLIGGASLDVAHFSQIIDTKV